MSNEAREFTPDWICPPEKTIRFLDPTANHDPAHLSARLDLSVEQTRKLLNNELPITQDIAAALAEALGGSQKFWRDRYILHIDAIRMRSVRLNWKDYERWLRQFPLKDMKKFGWIPKSDSKFADALNLLRFFNATSLSNWNYEFQPIYRAAAFRTSKTSEPQEHSLAAWLNAVHRYAYKLPCSAFDPYTLRQNIFSLTALSLRKSPDLFLPTLQRECARYGVALVVLPAPKGSYIHGLTTILPDGRAVLAVSFRYRSDDQFWFTFFHEIGHLVLHQNYAANFEGPDLLHPDANIEDEANAFAQNVLIPHERLSELRKLRKNYRDIIKFAANLRVSPGIIVGQMQHFGLLNFNEMNHLKRFYRWEQAKIDFSLDML